MSPIRLFSDRLAGRVGIAAATISIEALAPLDVHLSGTTPVTTDQRLAG